ncbi:MAG: ABC transporter permease [Deltaproteobacteria bacterium]|jgi:phospholipid/cholesterol/gamma-HCH transport system permease protein|nr:ABC transporter permease [Deltaproteobacteria bacterium]
MGESRQTDTPAPEVNYDITDSGALVIKLSGNWTLTDSTPDSDDILRHLSDAQSLKCVVFDTSALGAWDTVLLAFLKDVSNYCVSHKVEVEQGGLPEGTRGLLNLAAAVPERGKTEENPEARDSILEEIGRDAVTFFETAGVFFVFFGQVFAALGRFLIGKTKVRRADLFYNMQEAGVRGLPIISLITFLVGIILAYVSAAQLAAFGAKIFVAHLVGVSMAREMAPMMTAIIVAGRTGAAFAAQLGTMTVNEEIDAYRTLGLPPIETLVLPRVLALTLMMPFLVIYANLMGNAGSAAIAILQFDISAREYFSVLQEVLKLHDFAEGLIKAMVYGVLVAICGCLKGMHSGRSAGDVGTSTTSAVVMSLIMIVVASAILTMLFDTLRSG